MQTLNELSNDEEIKIQTLNDEEIKTQTSNALTNLEQISVNKNNKITIITTIVIVICLCLACALSLGFTAPHYNDPYNSTCGYGYMSNYNITTNGTKYDCTCYEKYAQFNSKVCNYKRKSKVFIILLQFWFIFGIGDLLAGNYGVFAVTNGINLLMLMQGLLLEYNRNCRRKCLRYLRNVAEFVVICNYGRCLWYYVFNPYDFNGVKMF